MSTLRLDRDALLRSWDEGRTLVGGSPMRVLRLSRAGASAVAGWFEGKPVPERGPARRLAERLVRNGMAHPRYEAALLGPADVTVVIPVRDQADGASAVADAVQGVAAVVVVDDGSANPVPDAAVRHNAALGPAAARNAGWRRASTPLVAFLDADTVAESGWLEPLLRHFDDPTVAAVAPRIRSSPRPDAVARYERGRCPLDLGAEPGPVRPGGRIAYVPSAALVVRADALRAMGGFDETLRFGEDVDFVWRLTASGVQVRYEPESVVGHAPRGEWKSWARQRFHYGTSAAPLALRHRDAVAPIRLSVWSAAVWAALFTRRSAWGVAAAGISAAMLVRKLGRVGVPARESVRLTVQGHLGAGRLLADAIGRPWAPLALPLLMATRRGRAVLALLLACHVREWVRQRPPLDPVRWTLARAADDLAYGAGVCWGAVRMGTVAPLIPHLTDVPGRESVPVPGQEREP